MKVKLVNDTLIFFEDVTQGSCGENRTEWEKKLEISISQISNLASQLEKNPDSTYFYI